MKRKQMKEAEFSARDNVEVNAQDHLQSKGYVVVPTGLDVKAVRLDFDTMIRESPEFLHASHDDCGTWMPLDDPKWKPARGGFAAMGNPSSFHHPVARRLCEYLMAVVLRDAVLPLRGGNLEMTFDRFVLRRKDDRPTEESFHRDEAPQACDRDVLFGGWVNLNDADATHVFQCCPGTHTEAKGSKSGFAKIEDPESIDRYRNSLCRVTIPSGHLLVFYERIVHNVVSQASPFDILRMHVGWRVTKSNEPLFGSEKTNQWIDEQAVPKIKSGQDPVVYPQADANFSRRWDALSEWSQKTFHPKALYTHIVKSKNPEYDGHSGLRVPMKFPSLQALGLPMHPPYDHAERALRFPKRSWELYAPWSPHKRVSFVAPSDTDWRAYKAARRQCRSMGLVKNGRPRARRPEPEQVEGILSAPHESQR